MGNPGALQLPEGLLAYDLPQGCSGKLPGTVLNLVPSEYSWL